MHQFLSKQAGADMQHFNENLIVDKLDFWFVRNLVPRAHVPFGQHQDTELWNNQFPETKILGLPVLRRMRGLVYMAFNGV